jgi:hypothetical protein
MARYYTPPKNQRLCTICVQSFLPKSSSQKYCPACQPIQRLVRSRRNAARRRLKLPERAKADARKSLERHREYYEARKRLYSTRYWNRTKRRVIGFYSNFEYCCACCGVNELEFLAIDHIEGGGGKQRKRLKEEGEGDFYHWLIKEGFPTGYQVLCHNCNWSKGRLGECVHGRHAPLVDGNTTTLDEWFERLPDLRFA